MYTMTTAPPGWRVIFSEGERYPVVAFGCDHLGHPSVFYVAAGMLRHTGALPAPGEAWEVPTLVFEEAADHHAPGRPVLPSGPAAPAQVVGP